MADSAKVAIELVANTAKFESDMNRATESLRGTVSKIQGAFAAIGVTLSVGAFAEMIKGAIDAQEELGRLAARAGMSGEALSSLQRAALTSKTPMEDVANMSARLSKALLEIDNVGSKSGAVLGALGIKSKDAARLLADPANAVFELSKRLNELPEGGTKAAAQLLLVGRSGTTTSAFMKDLAQQTGLVTLRTNEQIEAATKFNAQLVDLGIKADSAKMALANALLGTLSDIVKAFDDIAKGTNGAKASIDGLAADGSIKLWAQDTAIVLATVAESILALGRTFGAVAGSVRVVVADQAVASQKLRVMALEGSPGAHLSGALDAANAVLKQKLDERARIIANADKQWVDWWSGQGHTALSDQLRAQFAASNANAGPGGLFSDRAWQAQQDRTSKAAKDREAAVRAAVAAAGGGGADKWIGIEKAKLDAALKDQEIALKSAQDQFKTIGTWVQEYYDNSLVGISEFYDTRLAIIRDALAAEVAANNEQIRILQASPLNKDPKQRVEIEKKIAEIVAARSQAEFTAANATALLDFKRAQDADKFRDTVDEITIALARMNGEEAKAAALSFEKANRGNRSTINANLSSNDPEIRARAEQADAELNRLQRLDAVRSGMEESAHRFGNTLAEVGMKQQSIDLLAQRGAISEIDAMQRKATLAKEYIGLLQKQAAGYENQAATLEQGTQAYDDAVLKAAALRMEIERLQATATAVGDKFNQIFSDSFADAFASVIDGTKSVSDAFKDMERNIVRSISQIAAQNIAKAIFGEGGPAAGIGGLFAGLFGGLGKSAAPAINSFDPFGFFGIPGAAVGTNYVPQDMVLRVHKGEAIVPASANANRPLGKSNVTNINVNVLPGASRQSAMQAAAAQAREARAAAIRNG